MRTSAASTQSTERLSIDEMLAVIVAFFTAHPHHISLICDTSVSHSDVWDDLFRFYYRDEPTDVLMTYWRQGSTDPRWDDLLHEQKAMKAMGLFVAGISEKKIIISPAQEAA